MKILILTQFYPPEIGAAQTRLSAMIRELKGLGHELEVVTALPNYPQGRFLPGYRWTLYRREVQAGVAVHRVWLYPTVGGGLGRLLNFCTFCVTAFLGLWFAKKPDYLFVESPPLMLSTSAFLYSRMRGVPFILNIADLWPDTLVELGLLKKGFVFDLLSRLERWSYRKAAFVTAVTEGLRDSLLTQKQLLREKVLFLPNGVDIQRHRPASADEKLKQTLGLKGKKIILYSGTLGRAHGLEHVLAAARILENNPKIHFFFLGDGSERPALEKLQQEMGLRNVTFHDAVPMDRLGPFQSIADSGLVSLRDIPIHERARPSKMFPLLACGKPLIFCGKGEAARLLERARAGVVVPPEDPAALARAVSALFADQELVNRLGANGRKFVEENYQWSKLVGDWVNMLPGVKPAGSAKVSQASAILRPE